MPDLYMITTKDGHVIQGTTPNHVAALWAEYQNFEVWKDLSVTLKSGLVTWYMKALDDQWRDGSAAGVGGV